MELGPFSGHLFLLFSPSLHLLPVITRSIWFFLALGLVAWQHHPSAMAKKETLGRPELDASPLPAKRPWGGTKRKCRNIKPVLWALHLEAVPLPWPLHLAKSRL